ncbi:MAG TPA: heme exporter protein CcmD [Alphaproteobacteria bacterium]|nr:heme exporter protein CcmD [Alphaproteobacteria bacterium]
MNKFFDMGGYGAFVWPSYIITALVLAAVFVFSRRLLKSRERELADLQKNLGQKSLDEKD